MADAIYDGIHVKGMRFPLKPTGQVKWAYTSPWGMRLMNGIWRFHNGEDIGSSHYPHYESPNGWQLPAITDGEVEYRYDNTSGYNGNLHTDIGTFIYCHMQANMKNRTVTAGEPVGLCGGSGGVPAHLHLIWYDKNNPLPHGRNPRGLLDAIATAQWGDEHIPTPGPAPLPEDDMASFLAMNHNTGEQFHVMGNLRHYLMDESIPAQDVIDGLLADPNVEDRRDENLSTYLEGCFDMRDLEGKFNRRAWAKD